MTTANYSVNLAFVQNGLKTIFLTKNAVRFSQVLQKRNRIMKKSPKNCVQLIAFPLFFLSKILELLTKFFEKHLMTEKFESLI